ncbi:DUF3077 domain-containing protein [Pseudomonas sp. TNT2022 ID1044]
MCGTQSEPGQHKNWTSHFLQDMSKAIIDDVVKVLDAPCNNRT